MPFFPPAFSRIARPLMLMKLGALSTLIMTAVTAGTGFAAGDTSTKSAAQTSSGAGDPAGNGSLFGKGGWGNNSGTGNGGDFGGSNGSSWPGTGSSSGTWTGSSGSGTWNGSSGTGSWTGSGDFGNMSNNGLGNGNGQGNMGAPMAGGSHGSDGVEFQVIPIDYTVDCNSILLRGTQKFKGNAFVMPRGVISVNKRQETLFEIIPTSHGSYIMRFGLYFPRNNEAMDMVRANSHLNLKSCDLKAIVADLNKNAKDDKEKISRVAALPVTGIQIRIDGTNQPYRLGTDETALLTYQGMDHIVEFQIPSRDALDEVMQRLTGELGMQINMDFRFAARSSNGAVIVHIDTEQLTKGLTPFLQGQAWIAQASLEARIQSIMASGSAVAYTEDSSSPAFNQVATNLVSMMMMSDRSINQSGGSGSYSGVYGGSYSGSYGGSYSGSYSGGSYGDPYGSYSGGSYSGGSYSGGSYNGGYSGGSGWGSYSGGSYSGGSYSGGGSWGNPVFGGLNYGVGDPGQYPPPPGPPPGPGGPQIPGMPMVRVGAIFQYLKNARKIDVNMNNMSRIESHMFSTSVIFKAAVEDPGMSTLRLYAMDSPTTFHQYIKPGTSVTLYPFEKLAEKNAFRYEVNYFSLDEIRGLHLEQYFPRLKNTDAKFAQLSSPQGPRAVMFTQAQKTMASSPPPVSTPKNPQTPPAVPDMEFFIWGAQELKSRIEPQGKQELILTTANFDGIPIEFSFSEVGPRKFPLKELLTKNDYWDGEYDTVGAKIVFKAKKSLGTMTLWNTEKFPSKQVVNRKLFEQKWKRDSETPVETNISVSGQDTSTAAESRSIIKIRVKNEVKAGQQTPDSTIQVDPFPQVGKDSPLVVPGG